MMTASSTNSETRAEGSVPEKTIRHFSSRLTSNENVQPSLSKLS